MSCGGDTTCGCGGEAKPSRASTRRDVVLMDRKGRPFDRPRRADFRSEGEYFDAFDDYRRRVSDAMSNRGMQLGLERDPPHKPRGFAALTPEQRSAISRKGARAAAALGTGHRFTREEASVAGKKGGQMGGRGRARKPHSKKDALDNPTRREIIGQLVGGPLAVAEIARTLPISRPAVSQHLKVLKDAGLVEGRTVGRQRVYQVAARGLEKEDPVNVAVGVAIRKAREAAGVSTRDLGHMTGLGDSLVYKFESGEEGLSPSAMTKIANALDDLLCPDKPGGCVRSFFDRARAQVERAQERAQERDATYEAAKRHGRYLDANARRDVTNRDETNASLFARSARSARDPGTLVVGGLYYLEWDAHDEGDEGSYVYQGIYPQTGAGMFRRVSRVPSQRVTLYLFPHEVRYLELLERPRGVPTPRPRGVPAPPSSGPRRLAAPELFPGRVLARRVRAFPRVWDEGIVGPAIARAAQFQGYRRIDGVMFGVWSANGVLYAQPRRP